MKSQGMALAAVFLVTSTFPVLAQEAVLTVQKSDKHGDYIADANGRALYMFEADTQGKGDGGAVSACTGECVGEWPPFRTQGTTGVSAGAAGDLVGALKRHDGTTQVTYNGWPLYYFYPDENTGDITGHDFEDFGAEWYLLTPEGEKAHD
jgi:predicted lipoprotein with Yx(FWY)xxD motif